MFQRLHLSSQHFHQAPAVFISFILRVHAQSFPLRDGLSDFNFSSAMRRQREDSHFPCPWLFGYQFHWSNSLRNRFTWFFQSKYPFNNCFLWLISLCRKRISPCHINFQKHRHHSSSFYQTSNMRMPAFIPLFDKENLFSFFFLFEPPALHSWIVSASFTHGSAVF